MAEIKSALELALEKAERYGRASDEELARNQYREQGCQLAVQFLKGEADLAAELEKLPAPAQAAARQAIKEVLLRNLTLPRGNSVNPHQDLALEGLLLVAQNPKLMAQIQAELEQLLQQFLQVRNNALQQLKARFASGMGQLQKAVESQYHMKVNLEPENLPQFQEEWRRFQGQILDQVEPVLEQLKERMLAA